MKQEKKTINHRCDPENVKALVTGASGFIGRNLVRRLKTLRHEVIGIDVVATEGVQVRDVRSNLNDLMQDVDVVFHEAAMTSPPQFEETPVDGLNTNVFGTYNVLAAAAKAGVEKAVIASSSAIYGSISTPASEGMVLSVFQNLYPITKVFDEYLAGYFSVRNEIEVVSLRYFNTYGKGENSKGLYSSVISKFIDDIRKGVRPIIYGDGTQSRDFVYVKDVVEANILAMERGNAGEAYNVGTGNSTTFTEIARLVAESLGSDISPEFINNPFKNYQNFTQADMTKSEKELTFKAKFSLKDGIRDTLLD